MLKRLAVIASSLLLLAACASGGDARPPSFVSGPDVDPATLAGIQTGPPPWSPETARLRERLQATGIPPALTTEGAAMHIHQHVDVFVNGARVTVPALIGIITSPSVLYGPIHTHDTSGVIHVESAVVRAFSLGQFFDTWGVRFTQTCFGSSCNTGENAVKVFANGAAITQDPRRLELMPHEEIVVTYGTPAQMPRIPSSYDFPQGL